MKYQREFQNSAYSGLKDTNVKVEVLSYQHFKETMDIVLKKQRIFVLLIVTNDKIVYSPIFTIPHHLRNVVCMETIVGIGPSILIRVTIFSKKVSFYK